jgi:hypothetical protein
MEQHPWRLHSSNVPPGHSSIPSLAKPHGPTTYASPATTAKPTSSETAVIRATSSPGMTISASTQIIPDAIAGYQAVRTGKAGNTLLVQLKTGFGSALQELVGTIPRGGMGRRMRRRRCGLILMKFVPGCWREYHHFVDLSGKLRPATCVYDSRSECLNCLAMHDFARSLELTRLS